LAESRKIIELVYGKLKNLSHIFYSDGPSPFARLTACTGANLELVHQFYEFGYLDLVYFDKNLTELSYFPQKMKNVLRTFHKIPIFVKFHTIPLEKVEATGTHYLATSLIQVGYISENFELNIEAARKFELFWFNESWIDYRRTSDTFAIKCQCDKLYTLLDYKICTEGLTLLSLLRKICKK